MTQFLSGAASMGFLVGGLFFLRFWKKTRDRLFINFTLAFWLMAANQLVLSVLDRTDEARTYVYILRVFAFCLILFAIVDKNIFRIRRR